MTSVLSGGIVELRLDLLLHVPECVTSYFRDYYYYFVDSAVAVVAAAVVVAAAAEPAAVADDTEIY